MREYISRGSRPLRFAILSATRDPRDAGRARCPHIALEPLVSSCAAPRLPVAEPVYSADAVYDQVRESTVLAVENAKHAVGMA